MVDWNGGIANSAKIAQYCAILVPGSYWASKDIQVDGSMNNYLHLKMCNTEAANSVMTATTKPIVSSSKLSIQQLNTVYVPSYSSENKYC